MSVNVKYVGKKFCNFYWTQRGILASLVLGLFLAACSSSKPPTAANQQPVENPPSDGEQPTVASVPKKAEMPSLGLEGTGVRVTFKCDKVDADKGSEIERKSNGNIVRFPIADKEVQTYLDNTVVASTGYDYKVRCLNQRGPGEFSESKNIITAGAITRLELQKPTGLAVALGTSGGISATWTDPNENENGNAFERALASSGIFDFIVPLPANTTSYTDKSAIPGVEYIYQVRALQIQSDGRTILSGPSESRRAKIPLNAPAAPTALGVTKAVTEDLAFKLAWTRNSDNETGVEIERAPKGSTSFLKIYTADAGSREYTDGAVNEGEGYVYRVRAVNATGPSGYSNSYDIETKINGGVPARPLNFKAVLSSSSPTSVVDFTWEESDANVQSYELHQKTGPGVYGMVASPDPSVLKFSIDKLSADTEYSFKILAKNAAGLSEFSNEQIIKTSSNARPAMPQGFGASASVVGKNTLSWSLYAGPMAYFKMEKKVKGEAEDKYAAIFSAAQLGPTVVTIDDNAVSQGVNYQYRLRVVTALGTESEWVGCEVVSLETPVNNIVSVPSNLKAEPTKDSIILTWSDSNPVKAAFEFKKCIKDTDSCINFQVSNVSNTGYSDKVDAGKDYVYQVRTIKDSANVSEFSGPQTARLLDATVPAVADVSTVIEGTVGVTVKWQAIAGAAKYELSRSSDGGANSTLIYTGTDPFFLDKLAQPNNTYTYSVVALKTEQIASTATTVDVSIPEAACTDCPEAPTSLTVGRKSKGKQIKIAWKWKSKSKLKPSNFILKVSTDNDKYEPVASKGEIKGTKRSFTMKEANPSTKYYFRLWAARANKVSTSFAMGQVEKMVVKPMVPTMVVATLPNGKCPVVLTYKGSADTEKYLIYRADNKSNSFKQIGIDVEPGDEQEDGNETYIDSNCSSGKYRYKVKAKNSAGESKQSEASAAVSAP